MSVLRSLGSSVSCVQDQGSRPLIEAEAAARIGAEWNEHTETRTALRNGHRDKTLTTQAGDLDVAIPKLRSGTGAVPPHRPGPVRRHRGGLRPRRVHAVGRRPGQGPGADSGISKSEVSRICQDLDGQLTAFRSRPLDHVRFPYVYLVATYCKAQVEHQIVSRAVVISNGITEDRGREVLGVMVGDSETEVFWTEFLRHLRERGLTGVWLVIGGHHLGLVKAIRKVMLGVAYQRCSVHFLGNVFSVNNKGAAEMVAATIRTIFAQPTADAVRTQLDTSPTSSASSSPRSKRRYGHVPSPSVPASRRNLSQSRFQCTKPRPVRLLARGHCFSLRR
ncbi:transposase [Streptomyces sp. NPDC101149]|uniref:IS256 family transposase n=1 Tax=Streptomyces sp. NPDC101149 TaxID=3366113 RepID=UPI0037F8401A